MGRRLSSLLVLLLPQLILGYFHEGECKCGNHFFPPEALSISLDYARLNQSCSISCSYEIAPNPRLPILFIREQDLATTDDLCFQMDLYYLKYAGTTKERIYFTDLTKDTQVVFTAPVNVGLVIELQMNSCSEVNFNLNLWRKFDDRQDENPCPNPFLEVTTEIQTISTERWGTSGCTFRLTTANQTDFRVNCAPGSFIDVLGAEPGERNESWSQTLVSDFFEHLSMTTMDITAIGKSSRRRQKTAQTNCNITYVMAEEEVCECGSNVTLRENTEISLTSPGFPKLLCGMARCFFHFVREDIPIGFRNAFVLTIQHFRRHRDDFILIFPPDNETIPGAVQDKYIPVGPDQVERFVIQTGELQLQYAASPSTNKTDVQGFNLTMTVINVPEECRCPDIPSIQRESGVIRTTVPSNCPEMQCRYNVLYPNGDEANLPSMGGFTTPKYLKLEVAAEFEQSELLTITVDDNIGFETGNSSLAFLTSKSVQIVYRRSPTKMGRANYSFYEISYKWVYNTDCSCPSEDVKALAGEWKEFYSPQFPEGNSCQLECRSSIHSPEGHHLVVNVSFLGVKANCYRLNLYNGYNQTDKTLRQLQGGSTSMEMIRLPGQNATIEQTFEAICDRNARQGGYVIAYMAEKDVEGRGFVRDAIDFFKGLFYKEPKKEGTLFSIFKGSS